jgi:hypothetical protein
MLDVPLVEGGCTLGLEIALSRVHLHAVEGALHLLRVSLRNILGNLSSWDGSLAFDPLVLNCVRVLERHDVVCRRQRGVCHEAKATRLSCSFVFEDRTIFNYAELNEVLSKLFICEVVRKASDENLPKLRIHEGLLDPMGRLLVYHLSCPTLSLVQAIYLFGSILLVLR